MKHTRRWLALILAIALVAANASYQLGTSLYAKEDQAAVETQSEENKKQEAVNTEEPKSTGSAQVEEVQEDQNTSDDATQAEESKNTQADTKASSSADNNAEQNQADTAQANENAVAAATVTASDVAPTLAANTDGSVSGSGYDSIKLVVNTDGITNQNNTKFNIKFDTGNTENNKKISASNLNPSEGLASNLMKNRGGTYDVNGFNKNAFTITVTKGADCKNSIKTEATVDVASGTVTLNISDYYESSYNDKTFTNPTATSLGSVNDFAVFAKNYKNSNDMEGNIAVQNWTVGSHTMGMTGNIKDGHDYDISYVENIVGGLNKDEAFRSGNPLIIGDAYTPGTQDSNFTLTVNGVTKKIGNVTDVVNIKNSSYKIDFDTAMAGVRQYASAMYGKSDTKGVTFKNPNGNTTTKSDNVQTIQCKPNINNIINIKASDLKKWADNVQITGLGDTGSVTFNIKYDVAQQFTKPYFTINGTETGGYDVTGGRILLNFGTQQGALSFGELYSGTILAPNATVYISTTHNGSVFADTVENIGGEIHKNPWKPGNEQKPTSVKVTLKGTKTLNGTSAQKDAFSFLLQQTDENGTVLENGYQQNVKNGENGQISFDEITYTTPGTYYYKISEVSGSDVNIRYDASVYKVVVTVDENMTATVAYYKDGNLVNSDTGAAFSNTSIVREVKASLQGNKTLNGQPSTAAYKYQVVEVADEKGTVKDNAQSWEVTNNTTETAAIEFPEFTYNAAGDYYYKVTEVNANADGMEYDPSVYIAHVSVAAQNDGSLTASVTYRKYASADQMNPESAANADKITFANKTLKAQVTFTGNKTVNGSEAKDKFSFKVVEKDKDGNVVNTISDNITNKTGEGENGAIQFPTIDYTKSGTHYYEISENSQIGNSVHYDKTTYTAVVKVTKTADGLVASTKYYKDYNYSDTSKNKESKGTLDFANKMQTSIRLHGTKMLDNDKAKKDAFTFDIIQVDENGTAVANGYTEEVKNGANGAIESKDIPFTAPGTYYYKVTEKAGNKENIAYDKSYYTAVVTVEKNGLNLSASVQYYKNANGGQITDQTSADMTFQNKTKKTSIQLNGQKTLLGKNQSTGAALTLQDGEFSFDIAEADANGTVKKDASIKTVKNKADGSITFPDYEYNATGDYYYRISEKQSSNPAIAGMDYDESIYLVHVKVANNEAGDAFTAQIQDVVKYADQTALKDKNGTTVNGTEIANNNVAAFTNRVRYGSITFTGNKTLNDKPSAEVFRYTVVEKSADGGIVEDGYKSGVIKNDANGAIQFPAISYTKAGIHYYDVREINDSADTTGIAYDNTVYTVVVVVEDDNSESGTGLTTNAVYYKDFDYKTKTGTKVENNSITFANNMSASVSLEGMKTLDGKKVSKAGEYSFDIVETNASGDALEGEAPQSVSNDNTGKFTFPAYTYTDEGTHYYKITENQNNPKSGIKYDTSSYLVTVTVAKTVEDGKVSLKATVTDTKKTDANNTVSDTKDITFNNQTITYSDAKIQLTATKNLAGSPSEKEFDFKMEECDENGNVTAGTKVVTASNDKSGLITFDELTYKDAGTHYYKISEAAPENPEANIVYDNAAYIVKVDVTKDDTAAALTATASEYKKLVTGADGQTTTENAESVVFNNGIKVSTSFTGQKYVDGELASTAGAFSFTLTRTDDTYANALTGEDAYSETVSNDAAGNITFTEINYDTPGDYYYTISENVPEQQEANMYYDEAVYRAKVTVSKDGQVTVEKSVVPYDGYEGDDGNTFEPVEDDEFLIFNNYHFMTMSMDYALATITGTKTLKGGNLEAGEFRFGLYDSNGTLIDTKTNDASGKITFRTIPYYTAGTYSYTVKEINEQGENNVSDIEYDPSVYTVTVNVDENMDTSITYIKNGTNVDNSFESVDGISFENKMSVTAAAIDPTVKKVLNNAELQPGEFTFQLFDENNNLIDTKKNTDNGSVLFDSIIFDEVGDYNYTIKELIPSDPGQITYDDREIKVNVSVTKDDTTGNLEAAITYLEDNAPTEEPTFVNTYNPISIRVQKTSKDGSKDPLKGATYALYKVLSGEGRDILIGTQISDENGYMTFENVEPGTYYFKEVSAPAGHTVDEYATKKFTVSADGTINQLTAKRSSRSTQAVMFSLDSLTAEDAQISALEADDNKDAIVLAEAPGVSDEVTKLSVSKLDYTNHEFVTGAKMQILEKSSGKIVAEWTTGDSAESFERKLNVDTSYILREVSAPEGYDLAEDTEFIIDAYGILSIISGPDAEKTSDTALRIYDKKLGVTKVTKNTKENHNQKFVDVVKTVKTGDTAQIGLFAILSIAAIVVVIIVLRRRKNS